MEKSTLQKLICEFIGAFALVFVAVGALTATSIPGQFGGIVAVAFANGLIIAVMISAVGHISGAHFNPAVTAGLWIAQRIKSSLAVAYIVSQCAGAIAGALLLRVALPKGLLLGPTVNGGVPLVGGNISNGQAVLIEAILTFFLVWVIFGTAVDPEGSFRKTAALAIGFTVVLDVLMGGTFTGAAMNPARAIGPALVFGKWSGWWVYWVGPIAGGIVAGALYDGVMMKTPAHAAASDAPIEDVNSDR